ncbi:MAG: hypothetical protein SF051_07205 [Elusimicrobiota bacterium]|nr:hypothetical protein [Elusimicrobiota bacterium]
MSAAPAQKELLDLLLAETEAAAAKAEALVVFDLDDTLFLTANRHLRILKEYAGLIEAKHPEAASLLRAIEHERLRYAITDTVKEAGLADALAKDLKDFWFARFFKNPYLLEDAPIAGGPTFVAEVLARGGRAVYMTGRDEGMREGTEASLKKQGYALDGEKARLVLKPKFDTPDHAFKLECVDKLKAMGWVTGTFENEPAHVNLFAAGFPKARHFLLETKHSGKPVVPHPAAHRIRDFSR